VIVVADTSVLLNLCCVEQVDLLRRLFHEIIIPPEVVSEFLRLSTSAARFKGLTIPPWIRQQSPTSLLPSSQATSGLHVGELAALSLAIEVHADAILIDERAGYQLATRLGLKTIGLLGILLQAKRTAYFSSCVQLLIVFNVKLVSGSPSLRDQVLQIAGE
jgi:predicted nucleic acid-binding protein